MQRYLRTEGPGRRVLIGVLGGLDPGLQSDRLGIVDVFVIVGHVLPNRFSQLHPWSLLRLYFSSKNDLLVAVQIPNVRDTTMHVDKVALHVDETTPPKILLAGQPFL